MILKVLLVASLLAVSGAILANDPEGTTVPISGEFSGYILGFDGDPEAIDARCTPPAGKFAYAIASFEGWGTMTHLGSSYLYADHCSYGSVATGMPDGTYGEGQMSIIAANGDMLVSTYTDGMSLSPPPVIGFVDYVEFTDGGTGRFTFASGVGIDRGSVDFTDFSFAIEVSGTIAYKRK